MSLVLRIQQLVDTLFDNTTFQSKLKSFYETECTDWMITKQAKSVRTDISDKLQQSQSKMSYQVDMLVSQIQELLCQAQHGKNKKQLFQQMELCSVYEDIQLIKKQIQGVESDYRNDINHFKSQIQKQQNYVTIQQHRLWQQQILQKLDIVIKRNYCKLESVFADKLNSLQMSFQQKSFEQSQQKSLESSIVTNFHVKGQSQIKRKQQSTKKKNFGVNSQLTKKLTLVKSLGSLLGFKS